MTSDLFHRYVWLVDTLRRHGGLSYEELSKLWKKSPINRRSEVFPLRTFHNHRDVVEKMFGVHIICDRNDGNKYKIHNLNTMHPDNLRIWMLNTLANANVEEVNDHLMKHLFVDDIPDNGILLASVVRAIEEKRYLRVRYTLPNEGKESDIIGMPYAVRYRRGRWYLFLKSKTTQKRYLLEFRHILSIRLLKGTFESDPEFDAGEFFSRHYGVEFPSRSEEETEVNIKVKGKLRNRLRIEPLHPSQKEIVSVEDFSIFSYHFIITPDFMPDILALGKDVEVVEPASLRKEIARYLADMLSRYSEPAEPVVE